MPESHTLAGTDVVIPAMGVGTWAWGDESTWGYAGYDSNLTEDTIREAWDASIDAGVVLFNLSVLALMAVAAGTLAMKRFRQTLN